MPPNAFFTTNSRSSGQQKKEEKKEDAKTLFSTLYPLSTIIFATATVLAFVLLRDSRFNFHWYTQREATPTPKSVRKCTVTFRDFLRERLQSSFTLANQLRWIAQYGQDVGRSLRPLSKCQTPSHAHCPTALVRDQVMTEVSRGTKEHLTWRIHSRPWTKLASYDHLPMPNGS